MRRLKTPCLHLPFKSADESQSGAMTARISQEERLRHLVAYMCGVRHAKDEEARALSNADTLEGAIRKLALRDGYVPMTSEPFHLRAFATDADI